MDSIIEALNGAMPMAGFTGTQATQTPFSLTSIEACREGSVTTAAAVYVPRETITLPPEIAPRITYIEPPKIVPGKIIHEPPRREADPWALLPDSDVPATPAQLTSTAKSQATLPGETHAVAATPQRTAKSMLDLFV